MLTRATSTLIKDLKKQKRENCSLLFLDNIKIIKDSINNGIKPLYILVENEELNIWKDMNVLKVDRKTIEQLSDSRTPQGVVCITEYPQYTLEKPKTNFLVIDKLQDPGNIGTLIRTATACGFEYIFLLDSVRISNPKLIRSSVGTIFQTKIYSLTTNTFINLFKTWNLPLLKADMNGENIFNYKSNEIIGVVIGNEGNGVSNEISKLCSKTVSIPMLKNVESLNASISGAIIMYQIMKDKLVNK